MRIILPVLASLSLAACAAHGPGAGGQGNYSSYLKTFTDNAQTKTASAQPAGSAGTASATATTSGNAPGYLNPDRPRGGDGFAGIKQVHSELEYGPNGKLIKIPKENRAALSNEQSFSAVKAHVSIAQDAARLALMRSEYKIIPPKPLPQRPNSDGPNLVAYALNTTNPVGHRIYKRFSLFGHSGYKEACARYSSSDKAQMAFLAHGGPKRDPLGLDPDGDGYACYWDPAPFRHVKP